MEARVKFRDTCRAIKKLCVFRFLTLAFLGVLWVTSASSQTILHTESDSATIVRQEKLVREFIAAFNAHDTERMLGMANENIQWISIDKASASLQTDGIRALRESMDRYFKSCPSCKSTPEWIQNTQNRVITLERAEWTSETGLKSQKGLAVYEFRADKIARVYYFPAEISEGLKVPNLEWQKINANGLFTFRLPQDFTKTNMAGVENYLGEYRKGETRFLFIWKDTVSNAYDARRETGMEDYEEIETKIDGKQANIRIFSQVENGKLVYHAELNIGDWKNAAVELYMGLKSEKKSDLELAKKIFSSVDFP